MPGNPKLVKFNQKSTQECIDAMRKFNVPRNWMENLIKNYDPDHASNNRAYSKIKDPWGHDHFDKMTEVFDENEDFSIETMVEASKIILGV